MILPGAILLEDNDAAVVMASARELRARGQSVTVTPGISAIYAVRAAWDPDFLSWRKSFSAWLLERWGERS